MSTGQLLGEFLKARRALVAPEHVGLPPGGRGRRVPGLRREEVASLAGISVEYLTRLERGKDRAPSRQVLDALAVVLGLDAAAVRYLYSLVWPGTEASMPVATAEVAPGISRILARLESEIAYVLNPYFEVIARSPVADAFLERASHGSQLEYVFLDQEAAKTYPDWDAVAIEAVAAFRTMVRGREGDVRLQAILRRLLGASDRFGELWARHDVHGNSSGSKQIAHPAFGTMTVAWDAFVTAYPTAQTLVLHTVEPGTESARVLDSVRRSVRERADAGQAPSSGTRA